MNANANDKLSQVATVRELHLPITVIVFGDEIRALKRYYAEGLISTEEAHV